MSEMNMTHGTVVGTIREKTVIQTTGDKRLTY